jgi:N-methylhydantoinase B
VREYEVLDQEARFALRSTKHVVAPKGINGGLVGKTGKGILNPGTKKEEVLPARCSDLSLQPGDIFRLETPGGGGLGNSMERDPAMVLSDVINGYVSVAKAQEVYGVVVEQKDGALFLNEALTRKSRKNNRQ